MKETWISREKRRIEGKSKWGMDYQKRNPHFSREGTNLEYFKRLCAPQLL